MSGLFDSRWVDLPSHATEIEPTTLAAGFRAAGVHCGIKSEGLDLGLIVSDEAETTSAARFTTTAAPAPPVIVCKTHAKLDRLRAVVVNSGNANAATGGRGRDNAIHMVGAASLVSGVGEELVAVASTGVIGVQLPQSDISRGMAQISSQLRSDGGDDFSRSILTTDNGPKRAAVKVQLPSGDVTISAQAKGAGMMQPNHATMLCFIQTDAAMTAETCDLLLGVCVRRSFDRVTVDGQLSTNDSVFLQASGASGVNVAFESEDELRLGEALDSLLRGLAIAIIRDGEGARRIGRIIVRCGDQLQAETVARAVANSPLVKTALYGGDPNWGRIVQAAGMALAGGEPVPMAVEIEGVEVAHFGGAADYDEAELAKLVAASEVEYIVTMPGEGAEAEVYFSDLSHEYVEINSAYRT